MDEWEFHTVGYGGEPGTQFTNSFEYVVYQAHCTWSNSCARCIQLDGRIGPWWPFPLHNRCNCTQDPVLPGEKSRPFIDVQKKWERQTDAVKSKSMGDANRKLVEAGKVGWDDVVTPARIRPLHEVVERTGLSMRDLQQVGIKPHIITRTFERVVTDRIATGMAFQSAISQLSSTGIWSLTDETAKALESGNPLAPTGGILHVEPGPASSLEARVRTAIIQAVARLKAQSIGSTPLTGTP